MISDVAYDVIVLAGGRGERLGGTDKALLEVGGISLLSRVLKAVASAQRVVVVGPTRDGFDSVLWTVEDPPGGGPAAGIVSGLRALDAASAGAEWVVVLAVDQPGVSEVLPRLLHTAFAADAGTEAACPYDSAGHPQWLLAAYRRESLRQACVAIDSGHGVSVKRLVRDLTFATAPTLHKHLGDIDTWADHQAWTHRWER